MSFTLQRNRVVKECNVLGEEIIVSQTLPGSNKKLLPSEIHKTIKIYTCSTSFPISLVRYWAMLFFFRIILEKEDILQSTVAALHQVLPGPMPWHWTNGTWRWDLAVILWKVLLLLLMYDLGGFVPLLNFVLTFVRLDFFLSFLSMPFNRSLNVRMLESNTEIPYLDELHRVWKKWNQ